jgi:hypothetical protein
MLLAGTSAVLLAVQPISADVPPLVVYGCCALALSGAYGMLAPLLHLPPWRRPADMNRLLGKQFRDLKRRRFWRRVLRRPPPEPVRTTVGATAKPAPLSSAAAAAPPAHAPQIVHVPTSRYQAGPAKRGDARSASAQGSGAAARRQLIERGEDLKGKVCMERIMIEHNGRQIAQEHMLKEWTDAARRWGTDAGFATEPPPIGFFPTGPPAAQRKVLEDWIGGCVDALKAE